MLDIHSHILPGLDDGAGTRDMAVRMARVYARTGVTGVVATPHFIRGSSEIAPETVREGVFSLGQTLGDQGIKVRLYPGMEIELSHDIPDLFKKNKLLTINNNGKYLLIELPFFSLPPFTFQVLYELNLLGVTTILAHPERNGDIGKDISLIEEMVSRGAIVQINGGSILGHFGGIVKKTAVSLLKRNLVQAVAGDAHQAEGARGPCLYLAFPLLEKLIGTGAARVLTVDNPQAIIAGEKVDKIKTPPPRGGLTRLFQTIFPR